MDLCTNAAHGRLGMQTQVATAGATDPPPADMTAKRRGWPALQWAWVRSARLRSARVVGRLFAGLPASTWLLMDLALLSGGVYASFSAYPPPALMDTPHVMLWQAQAVIAFAFIISSMIIGLYERETLALRSRVFTRVLLTAGVATIIAYTIIYVVMYATISRRITALAMTYFVVSGILTRFAAFGAIRRTERRLLVVGPRSLFESFQRAQQIGQFGVYKLLGFVTVNGSRKDRVDSPHYLGTVDGYFAAKEDPGATDIVIGNDGIHDPKLMDWIRPSLQRGCRVTDEATFYEKATGQIPVDQITPSWFLFADLKTHCDQRATLKRLLDMVVALIGLCLSAPLWPLIAIAIKLNDRGPVFYSQDRVGENGKVFRLHKFRTMRTDAENGKSVWASPNDPRVTRVGRILRKTRLDELPQLYNILLGRMSMVGPRPERPDIVEELSDVLPYYSERHLVKPGLTGWAQISFRYGASVEDAKRKLEFDLYYLKHTSFELDLMIIFRTVGTFLRGGL